MSRAPEIRYLPRQLADGIEMLRGEYTSNQRDQIARIAEMAFAEGYHEGYVRGNRDGWSQGRDVATATSAPSEGDTTPEEA